MRWVDDLFLRSWELGIDAALERDAFRKLAEATAHGQAGEHALAQAVCDSVESIAREQGWQIYDTPALCLELHALQCKLLDADAEPLPAYEVFARALTLSMQVGDALCLADNLAEVEARTVLRSAEAMVEATAGHRVPHVARTLDVSEATAARRMWIVDRLRPQLLHFATRTIELAGVIESYEAAVEMFEIICTGFRRWIFDAGPLESSAVPWAVPFWRRLDRAIDAIFLQYALLGAAAARKRYYEAMGHLDAVDELTATLHPSRKRLRQEASNTQRRAELCGLMGQNSEAASHWRRTVRVLDELGLRRDRDHARVRALQFEEVAGMRRVPAAVIRSLLHDLERPARSTVPAHVSDEPDDAIVELLRRWYLSILSASPEVDFDEVMRLIAALRGAPGDEHVQDGVTRFGYRDGLLWERIASLPSTALVLFEPGLWEGRPAQILTIGPGEPHKPLPWVFTQWDQAGVDAMRSLSRVASEEYDRVLTGIVSPWSKPAIALVEAAESAWNALPDPLRTIVRETHTLLYMPSYVAEMDIAIPLELLRHPDGWLGTTHVIARLPSFSALWRMLAPNSVVWADNDRATVSDVPVGDGDQPLLAVAEERAVARHAIGLLGMDVDEESLVTGDQALAVLKGRRLLHYIGHGIADELGEFLPLLERPLGVTEVGLRQVGEEVPFVFFSACSLGRGRYSAGHRGKGWTIALLERGAPGIVGALYPVTDQLGPVMAKAFYRGAWKTTVGEGMRRAREQLGAEGLNPVVWSAYVYFGDPNAVISRASLAAAGGSREMARHWPATLMRLLATSASCYRDEFIVSLQRDPLGLPAHVAEELRVWADHPTGELSRAVLDLCLGQIALGNRQAAVSCRILALTKQLEGSSGEQSRAQPVGQLREALDLALTCDDQYAVMHLVTHYDATWEALQPSSWRGRLELASNCLLRLSRDRKFLTPLVDTLRARVVLSPDRL